MSEAEQSDTARNLLDEYGDRIDELADSDVPELRALARAIKDRSKR